LAMGWVLRVRDRMRRDPKYWEHHENLERLTSGA